MDQSSLTVRDKTSSSGSNRGGWLEVGVQTAAAMDQPLVRCAAKINAIKRRKKDAEGG